MFRPFAAMLRTSLTFNFDYIAINGVFKTSEEVNNSLEEGVFEVLFWLCPCDWTFQKLRGGLQFI